jgi:MinD-like ATPase involved in chromosome partitioning or flagellar assembly
MKVLVFTSSKGGVGKTMAATLVGQSLARRGHRAGFADFSGIAPNASGRWGEELFRLSGPVATWLDNAPVSVWPVDPASGLRLLAGPASLAQRVGAQMADCLHRVLAEAAAALDVLVIDLDGVQNIELHRVALEAATSVVWVVDHSPETVSEVQASLIDLARPADQARNGLPLLTSDRCRFVMVDHKNRGRSGPAQAALRDLGSWCGTLRFSARLEALAAVGQLAGAIPREVLADADRVASAVLPSVVPKAVPVLAATTSSLLADADAVPAVDADGVLRVFAGPVAPVAVSAEEFRVLVALTAAAVVDADQAAQVLGLKAREFSAVARGLLRRHAVGDVRRGSIVGLQWPSDVTQMRVAATELQGGGLDVPRVRRLLSAVTGPVYGGGVGQWTFTAQWPSGVSLARRAEDALRGLADQIAGHGDGGSLRADVMAALERARVGDARWLDSLKGRFAERPTPAPVFSAPSGQPLPPPPLQAPQPDASSSVAVASPVLTAPAPAVVATPVVVKAGAHRPRVMVRLFGQVAVQSWPAGDPMVSRGLAVPVALAVTGKAMQQSELCELTSYSEATLKNTFPAGHAVVGRDRGVLFLADGVAAEHEWLATLVRGAAEAVSAGRPGDAVNGVVEALAFAQSVTGRPFEVCPRSPDRRGGGDVWAWVDEPLPGEWRSPREIVGRRWVESLVMAVRLWRDLDASEMYPESLVVEQLCRAAWMIPLTGVPGVAIDGWSTSAHVLLIEARRVAGRSPELVGQVHAMAAELVGSGDLEPDDGFAEALGLART